MGYQLLSLLCGLVALAALVGLLVMPIIALTRTKRIGELLRRVAALEREVRQLRGGELPKARPIPELNAAPESAKGQLEEESSQIPEVVLARRLSRVQPAMNIEAWIGGRALGWIAVVLLVFAVGFFLRHVFENDLVGPLVRVAIILAIGLGLCLGGWRFHQRGWWVFGQFLTSGGVVLLYLATFSSFGYYTLLPRQHAALFLVAIIVEAAALAIMYEAPAIAIMAVIGGLLTPVLLRSDHDQYQSLFIYLILLNTGFVVLTLIRVWPAINTIALIGTQLLFWGWYIEHFHPEKQTAALAMQGGLFGLYLAHLLVNHTWAHRRSGIEDLGRLCLNPFLFAVAVYVLVEPDETAWRGTIAMGLALIYTLVAVVVDKISPRDIRLLFAVFAVATALMATSFCWQAHAAWIALCWAVEGGVLWWFGSRIRAPALCILGGIFLVLGAGRLVFIDTLDAHPVPFVPIFNKYGVPAVTVALALLASAVASRRFLGRRDGIGAVAAPILGVAGMTLLWFVLSFETYKYFDFQGVKLATAQTSLSVLWAVYAMVTLAAGFRLASRPLRWFALALFGLTLVKVALVDTAELEGMYRVTAFLALSVMMALAAWGYQKLSKLLLTPSTTEDSHETP